VAWWTYLMVLVGLGWGSWITLKVISLEISVTKLRGTMDTQMKRCDERLAWMGTLDEKTDKLLEGVARIEGRLGDT